MPATLSADHPPWSVPPGMPPLLQPQDLRTWAERGYFIVRGLVEPTGLAAVRAGIVATVAAGGGTAAPDLELAARASGTVLPDDHHARLRKLGAYGRTDATAWRAWWANPRVLDLVRAFVGPDAVVKYDAVFLKPARCGGATPWHQDPGLWCDGDVFALNGWIAIDRADRANGCLQVVPGSHVGPVIPHVIYDDSIHRELPRERCRDLSVDHIELDAGDALFWHSNLWHYSPPNHSARDRIGMGAVWTTAAFAATRPQLPTFRVLRDGVPVADFPPVAR